MSLSAPGGLIDPEKADNFEDIEKQFAVKVVEHMTTYWAILEKMPGSKLRLTKYDDEILEHFKSEFPDFDLRATINEDDMKSKEGKERWRNFINAYENKVEDYNFGTMLRANPTWEYGQKETIFAVRMQFYAVEIARNRESLNDWVYEQAQKAKASHAELYLMSSERLTGEDLNDAHSRMEHFGGPSPVTENESTSDEKHATPWRSLFFFTTKANLPILITGGICSVIAGAGSPFQSYLTGKLFEGFTSYASGAWTTEKFMHEQTKYVIYMVAVAGASWVFLSLEFMLWLAFGELQAKSARDRLFHGLLEKDVEWYDMRKNGIGALLPRLQAQIRDLQLATSQPMGLLFSATAQCVLSLAEAFYYQWKLTFVTLSTAPVIIFLFALLAQSIQANIANQQEKLAEAQKYTTSAFFAIETVKCFNGQEVERKKYMACVNDAASWYVRVIRASSMQMGLAVFLGSSMFVQGFFYGGVLIRNGEADVARIITAFLAAIGGFQALQMILPQVINLEKGRTAGATLRAVMAEVQRGGTVRKTSGLLHPSTCVGNIDVKNLTFAYPSRPDQVALDNVTMFIPGGEMTFLIGRSGSGKSTLSQLLMGFYAVHQGEVTVDGVPLDSLDVGWLRSNVTLVEQQSLLFNDTVFRNIAFGRNGQGSASRQEVMDAAEFALLQLMITDMSHGLDTVVGYKGGSMSGGQRQRMALARARLRDTPILILDESTSALDHISRALMMDVIRQWRRGKTTIVITHDISQIAADDYLYLLEEGTLVQEGYRKHLEKIKDSPFQSFLPLDQRATVSPLDARKGTVWESIYTRGSSLDTLGVDFRQSYVSHDPLEAHLDASENKRASFLPSVLEGGGQMPVMGAFGRVVPGGMAPWMRTTKSPPRPTSLDQTKRFSQVSGSSDKPATSPDATGSGHRWSYMMERLVDRTGKFAAESRSTAVGTGRLRRPLEPESELDLAETGKVPLVRFSAATEDLSSTESADWTLRRIMGTIWPIVGPRSRAMLIVGFYGCTVHAIATPMFSFVLSKLLATYANPQGAKHKQLVYSMIILGIAIVDAAHTWLQRFLLGQVGQRWIDSFRDTAVERILDQPKAWFDLEENSVSHLTDSLDRNAESMRELLATYTALGYIAVLMCSVSVVWAFASQWKMTLMALSVAPYILGVSRVFAAISGKWETRSTDAAESASAIFTETFTNIKTVRAFTLEEHFKAKYIAATNHALTLGFQRAFYTGFFFGLSDSAVNFATALVFYVGSLLIKRGAPVNSCIEVVVMLMFALTNASVILECIPQVGNSRDAAARLMRLAGLAKDSHEHLGDTGMVTVGEIMFDNLRFAYPSRPEQTVLKDITLMIEPGTSTAIVGGSGSGKSTIANLLLDIWSTAQMPAANADNAGELIIGGREIRTLSTRSLRSLIVPVLQTPTLFAATVADNISYGLDAASPHNNLDAVIDAAQRAGLHDFITSLPLGYDTLIGDGGMGLSGGQAQRVAIARALVRKPCVLVLDEATSALDVESAALVRQTIQELVRDRSRAMTVVIITHSRDMMEMAEHVVVLDQGEIVEEGGFEELLGRDGALANLLSGGEWTKEKERAVSSTMRGVPKLEVVDWRMKSRRRNGSRSRR
ncbi:ATP-dependent permease [Friedmanniomyces endolithicus]|nr:ATP-dependent permease [Friedmanniomyces endolithicus]